MRLVSCVLLFFLSISIVSHPVDAREEQKSIKDRAPASVSITHGRLKVPGLQQSVKVLRDRWGVAHIYAENVTVQVPTWLAWLVLDKSGRISHATVNDCENWATNCKHRWPC